MSRREFIAFLIGGAGASFRAAAWAQSPQQVRRVGVLLPFDENDPEAKNRVKQFRLGMRDLGWIEERDVVIDFRFTGANSESIRRRRPSLPLPLNKQRPQLSARQSLLLSTCA